MDYKPIVVILSIIKKNIISHGKDLMTTPQELTKQSRLPLECSDSPPSNGGQPYVTCNDNPVLCWNGMECRTGTGIVLHPHQHCDCDDYYCQSNWLLKPYYTTSGPVSVEEHNENNFVKVDGESNTVLVVLNVIFALSTVAGICLSFFHYCK